MKKYYAPIEGAKLEHIVHDLPFTLGNVLKYVWRAPYKGGAEDCIKALDYLLIFQEQTCQYSLSGNARDSIENLQKIIPGYDQEKSEDVHRTAVRKTVDLIKDSTNSVHFGKLDEIKDAIIQLLIAMHNVESSR